ncbi:hypothetical protein DICVIV_07173 [Dictyocaulus viviparus]|uniref:Uncharacterized protein n=1 Tax=Dictyocaulus viviparus TaxID=29172 RepID=A0A0D8XSJ6_DICVI|nr:hypothetical protein DICVIV_07173 [Dictyocaulus viviparus]
MTYEKSCLFISRLALSCQNRYEQAVEAYKKALELDPTQESFKNNLRIAEEKVKELETAAQASGAPSNPFAAMFGGTGEAGASAGVNFASLFNNPQMLSMAQSLMNDPNIQNMMGQLMAGGAGFGNIFQAGQQNNSDDNLKVMVEMMGMTRVAEIVNQINIKNSMNLLLILIRCPAFAV